MLLHTVHFPQMNLAISLKPLLQGHLIPGKMKGKVARGKINLPLVCIEASQKAARGVHLNDLAAYLDAQHAKAKSEHDKLMGRGLRRVS